MNLAISSSRREQSLGEEIANSVSHGLGLVAALVAVPFLLVRAVERGGGAEIAGTSIFAGAMLVLYLASTLYHALPRNRAKSVFQVLDHGAIFLLIAGTYTPFMLGALRGAWGWTLLGIVWSLAVGGVVVTALGAVRHRLFSTCLYLAMGWLIVIAIRPLWLHVPRVGLVWLAAGGLAYTGGVAFYATRRLRYGHFVWHLFVLAGTTCHYFAVLWYAA